jgi:hypothetical protein
MGRCGCWSRSGGAEDGIARFDFDTILLALNAADRYHLPFMDELLPLANRKPMASSQ